MPSSLDPPLFDDLIEHADVQLSEAPCGPDLEYHPSYLDFVASARTKPEQQLGDSIISAREPDWRIVFSQGLALARDSRDLRIAAVLVQAATELHGLAGFAKGLTLIRVWLDRYWHDLHPRLTVEGEFDPLMRMNALSALADPIGTLRSLRHAPFLEGRFGRVSVGEAESILKGRPVAEAAIVTTAAQLERLLADESQRNASQLAALSLTESTLAAIESLWRERLQPEYWPELDTLRELLTRLSEFSARHSHSLPVAPPVPSSAMVEAAGREACTPAVAMAGLPDELANRREAFQALAIARRYFELHEPSHPAPLLIKRIERLEGLGFMDILAELSPDALTQIRHITGTTDAVG